MMVKSSVILAPDTRGALEIFTVPAIRRLVLDISRLGIKNTHVVGDVDTFKPMLSDLLPDESFHPAHGLQAAERAVESIGLNGEQILVARANYVANRDSLLRLLEAESTAATCRMKSSNTKGAHGVYLTHRSDLDYVVRTLWSPSENGAEASQRAQQIEGPDDLPHVIEDGPEDAAVSESKLVAALASRTHADDGFIARHFDRHISRWISSRLARTRITPNQVTLTGMTIGLVAASLLAIGGYWLQLAGSLLFVLCVIIDGVDGEIARLKLRESNFGHYLDVITDNIVHAAIFIGIGVGLYHQTAWIGYIWALWFLLGGFGLCAVAVYQCILRLTPDELERSPKLIKLMALLSNRDFAYLVAVLALFGLLGWFLMGAALGTYVFAFSLWGLHCFERRNRAEFSSSAQSEYKNATGQTS